MHKLTTLLQFCLPQHLLSRCAGFFANCRWPWLKNKIIVWFIHHYHVDMSLAEKSNPQDYLSFNDFFTRKLKPDVRPIMGDDNTIICPVDGVISQAGNINHNQIFQAKGFEYSLESLLANTTHTHYFLDGQFVTIYLSPKDYHRVHMPITGTLVEMIYVPGRLFSVNPTTSATLKNLYARNERVIAIFKTPVGTMAVILVGAMIVASIKTAWAGKVAPNKNRTIQNWSYESSPIQLQRGEELGQFELGSTVIVLLEKNKMALDDQLKNNEPVKMGIPLGEVVTL